MMSDKRSSAHSESMTGSTMSSATSNMRRKSIPVRITSLTQTATSDSEGVMPAPAPKRRVHPSHWVATAPIACVDVGLGEVRRDTDHRDAEIGGGGDVVLRAEAGKHERGDLRLLRLVDRGRDQRPFIIEREAVVERRATKAVTVAHLDDGHPGAI